MRFRVSATFSTSILLILLALAWWQLAPQPFGGRAAYVLVNGSSMLPALHDGDLVVLQAGDQPQIGDVVAYRAPDVGTVLHRIIAREGDHFILQGDNNSWRDGYRPAQAEIIGVLRLRLPGAGRWVQQIQSPPALAVLAAVATTIATLPAVGRGKKRRPGAGQAGSRSSKVSSSQLSLARDVASGVMLLAGLPALILAPIAFSRPLLRETTRDIPYAQKGAFHYSAVAPPGLYNKSLIETGEPVFTALTSSLLLTYDYQLQQDGANPAGGAVHGHYQLAAEVGDLTGWKRTLSILPRTAFQGTAWTASGVLDLAQVQQWIAEYEEKTGLIRPYYTVAVTAEVNARGSLSGQPFQDRLSQRLEFRLDDGQLYLSQDGAQPLEQLQQEQPGLLRQPTTELNTLSLLQWSLPVQDARWLAIAGIILAADALLVLLLVQHTCRANEAAGIQLKYGSLIVSARPPEAPAGVEENGEGGRRVLNVATIDDLARLVAHNGRPIVHSQHKAQHHYTVWDGEVAYRYTAGPPSAATEP